MTHTHELEDLDLAGLSPSLAVPVKGAASASAPAFERTYLEGRFGPYGVRWQLVFQGLSFISKGDGSTSFTSLSKAGRYASTST